MNAIITIAPPIILDLQVLPSVVLSTNQSNELAALFITWRDTMITYGEKSSARDAGKTKQISFSDDYMYFCVLGGIAGSAIWKKTLLFQT